MKTNPHPIEVIPKIPRSHQGFLDSLGRPLAPGDEIIVKGYDRLYHAVITRFTAKRIYWRILYADDSMPDYVFSWENLTQLHNWYADEVTGHSTMHDHPAENRRRLRNVMKVEQPEETTDHE